MKENDLKIGRKLKKRVSEKKAPFDKWVGRLKAKKGVKTDAIIAELRGK